MGPSPALLMRHRIMRNRWMTIGLLGVAGLALVALAAPWLAPRDPYHGQLVVALREPSPAYLFGTDAQGRDVLSRVLFAARLSLAAGRVRAAARDAPRAPQHPRPGRRRRHAGRGRRHHGGGRALVRRARGPAAHALLGRDGRRGTRPAARCPVGVALPRARDRPHGAGRESGGRRVARRAGRPRMTDIAYHPARLKAVRDQFRALRAAEFPWTADTVYLNNASTGPIPERTRRALDEFTAQRTAPHLLPDRELQAGLQAARAAVAHLINADASEIALATNTSHGLNLAARA